MPSGEKKRRRVPALFRFITIYEQLPVRACADG